MEWTLGLFRLLNFREPKWTDRSVYFGSEILRTEMNRPLGLFRLWNFKNRNEPTARSISLHSIKIRFRYYIMYIYSLFFNMVYAYLIYLLSVFIPFQKTSKIQKYFLFLFLLFFRKLKSSKIFSVLFVCFVCVVCLFVLTLIRSQEYQYNRIWS